MNGPARVPASPPSEPVISSIEVMVPYRHWLAVLPKARMLGRRAAKAALTQAGAAGHVTIVLADDILVRDLNHRFRKIDKPTNVLSFPAGSDDFPDAGGPAPLGDIILAFETVESEAVNEGKSLADHMAHLVVHGILHLLGQDHQNQAEALAMEQRERLILAGLKIADPYVSSQRAVSK